MLRAGAGASSTSVRSPPGSWVAARMADLIADFHTSPSQGSTSLSFHSRRSFSVSVLYVILGFPGPSFPSICMLQTILIAPLNHSICPNQRSIFSQDYIEVNQSQVEPTACLIILWLNIAYLSDNGSVVAPSTL